MTYCDEERVANGSVVHNRDGQTDIPVNIESRRFFKGVLLLQLAGYDDINQVERFKGCSIFSSDDVIDIDDPNVFRVCDLIGLKAIQFGVEKGEISGVRNLPQGDYLEITKKDGSIALVPFRDEFVGDIRKEEGKIIIVDMEGLL